MPGDVTLSISTMYAFLLVLARVGGAFIFVPLPGVRNAPELARVVMALTLTMALYPVWPDVDARQLSLGRMAGWMLAELGFGLTVGLAVAFINESLLFAAQVLGLQAGFGYASMVDPNTQADSSILMVFAQLTAGLLFFTMGLDREVVRALASSLQSHPPGTFVLNTSIAEGMIRTGSGIFSTGIRLALPAVAFLTLVDLALALVGRLNQQLQLLTLSFPAKMLVGLIVLAWTLTLFPRLYRGYASDTFRFIHAVVSP
jgi:flagellar biosynthesis protein FliR